MVGWVKHRTIPQEATGQAVVFVGSENVLVPVDALKRECIMTEAVFKEECLFYHGLNTGLNRTNQKCSNIPINCYRNMLKGVSVCIYGNPVSLRLKLHCYDSVIAA